jgi:threonine synthase
MGLPVLKFVAATNVNDVVPEYLSSGTMTPRPSRHTLSNAMDVGNPSNFARMMDLYSGDLNAIRNDIAGYAFTDAETQQAMKEVFEKRHYTLDPHGAVGYLGLKKYLAENDGDVNGIFLETAHPAKFGEVVEGVIKRSLEIPPTLQKFVRGKKQTVQVAGDYPAFKGALRRQLH